MLDSKFIRENRDLVFEAIRKKNVDVDLGKWLELDSDKKILQQELEVKRALQNKISKEIATAEESERKKKIAEMSNLKQKIKEITNKLKTVEKKWQAILMNIPNIVSPDMPEGKTDKDNLVIKKWGKIPKFGFEPKEHHILGKELDLIDTEKAAEVSGSRFYYLKNELVLMQFALMMFAVETVTNEKIIKKIITDNKLKLSTKPFVPIIPPVMIRDSVQKSIHRVFGDQTYSIKNEDLNLVASAEHTLAPYHMNEVLDEKDLPKRYIGFSTAFRREAGTYGKDMGGIFRSHQFDKSEMESFTTAETGTDEQKMIVGLQEYMMQKLEIPYRLVHVCVGDTGKPDYDQYDIEAWLPGQKKYRETHTSDYMTDYQTRGIKSFYKTNSKERRLLHTNDATAFAGRPLVAIMENFQQDDGSIVVPRVLHKWMPGKIKIIKNKK